jgi:O-antigen/teichoic acid export membrane protein
VPPTSATSGRLLRSAGAATVSQFWRVGVVFLTQLVLRRLLPAEAWGTWWWIDAVFLVLAQLRDLGMPAHFIRLTERPYGTFLRFELVWGAALAVFAAGLAPWLARLHQGDPALTTALLQSACLFLFLEGLAKVPLTWFEAELRIAAAVPAEVARNLTYMLVAILLALAGAGAWSFLLAQLAGVVIYVVLLWWRAWGELPLAQSGETGVLLRGALPLAGVALLVTGVSKVDAFVLGGLVDVDRQGAYNFAYQVGVMLLANVVVLAFRRALYPALVAYREQPELAFRAYHLTTLALVCLEIAAAGFLWLNAELVLAVLGGRRNWDLAEVAGYLRLLVLAPLVQPFARCAEDVLIAQRRDGALIALNLLTAGSYTVLGAVLTSRFGAIGMAWANLVPLGSLVAVWAIWSWSARGLRQLGSDLLRAYLVGGVIFVPAIVAAEQLALGPVGRAGLGLLAVASAAFFFHRRFGTAYLAFFRSSAAG